MKEKPKPDATWSMRRLRNYQCGWCDQRLNEAKRGNCAAIYRDEGFECYWKGQLNATSQGKGEGQ